MLEVPAATRPWAVRRASAADLPSLCALGEEIQASHWQAWPELFARIAEQQPYWRAFVEKPDHAAFVALDGERIVGMAAVTYIDDTAPIVRPRRVCRLQTIVVTEAARRKGVARALVASVESWAREIGASDLRLTVFRFNEAAIAAYEELGFAKRAHVMGKFLDPGK